MLGDMPSPTCVWAFVYTFEGPFTLSMFYVLLRISTLLLMSSKFQAAMCRHDAITTELIALLLSAMSSVHLAGTVKSATGVKSMFTVTKKHHVFFSLSLFTFNLMHAHDFFHVVIHISIARLVQICQFILISCMSFCGKFFIFI